MAISFQYSHEFKGKRANEVFDKIMVWLTKEDAKKVVGTEPTRIEAIHGSHRTVKGWKRNAKKELTFDLSQSSNGVVVSVNASPVMINSSDLAQMAEDARLNWGMLLEECWGFVEGKTITENGERLKLEKADLVAKNREEGKRMFLYGSMGVVIVFAAIFTIVGVAHIPLPSVVFIIPGTMCAMTALWGATKMRSK
ncbi:MAG: hypothetical protein SA339_12410 [Methanomassiliicoccus sp.]|nr:hypothetical protein [Methanomassiliicoccus sp.]